MLLGYKAIDRYTCLNSKLHRSVIYILRLINIEMSLKISILEFVIDLPYLINRFIKKKITGSIVYMYYGVRVHSIGYCKAGSSNKSNTLYYTG